MIVSQLLTGLVSIILGVVIIIVAFFTSLVFLIHGSVLLIVGLFILFNSSEDKIEQIKKKRR